MIFDIFISIILFIAGFSFISSLKFSRKDTKNLQHLWLFHIIVAIGFYFFTRNGGGDAWGYWRIAQGMTKEDFINSISASQGTEFMNALNYIPANILNMGFFVNTIFYAFLGFIGFALFYNICISLIPYNTKIKKTYLFPLLLFLPNLHFWSSGVGKDTILFLCVAIVAYGLMNIVKRFPLIAVGLLLSFFIRPHITLFLVASFGLAYVINGKISKPQRIFLSLLLLAATIIIIPIAMEFAKIEEASIDSFEDFSGSQAAALSRSNTGSAVDISSYPYPLKILTFLYRPTFFDINGLPALIASFENLLLLILSIQAIRKSPVKTFRAAPLIIQGLLIFLIIGTFAFSASLGNLGIMLRMRNMFLPGMIIYILWAFSYKQECLLKHRKNA